MEKYLKPDICVLYTEAFICANSTYGAPELTDSDYNPWSIDD